MVSMSFSCTPERMSQIYALNQEHSQKTADKDIPISETIGLLIQRGFAYTLLLKEKAEEIKTPEVVAVKPKHRNKKW